MMQARSLSLTALAAAGLASAALPARAEITSVSGTAQVVLQEFRYGEPGQGAQASGLYPQTTLVLPLQVVTRLTDDGDPPAAAVVAAQFADPRDLAQPNPEEFAIDLALLSASPSIRYTGRALAQEQRGILFTAAEFPGRAAGEIVPLTGQLFVDGALCVFSPTEKRDLSGANITLRITVVKQTPGVADETVFTGSVGLQGGPDGKVEQFAEGSFPTGTLIRSDLAAFLPEFAVFEVLILPNLTIPYAYSAAVGEAFTLQATVEVEAANAEDEVGVSAVIGTPVDAIRLVIAAAEGEAVAAKTIRALQRERAQPSGHAAFPAPSPMLRALPLCGVLGWECALGAGALAGWRCLRPRFGRMRPD